MSGAGYSKRSLAQKLGIPREGAVAIVAAPREVLEELDASGIDVRTVDTTLIQRSYAYIHLFLDTEASLAAALPDAVARLSKNGMLWVSWPKKASKVPTDLNESVVRTYGLEAGVVDVKVCAVSLVWSGLKFVFRLSDR